MNKYTFFFRSGGRRVGEGADVADAFTRLGFGAGATRALDFYANGDDDSFQWNVEKKAWESKTPRWSFNVETAF